MSLRRGGGGGGVHRAAFVQLDVCPQLLDECPQFSDVCVCPKHTHTHAHARADQVMTKDISDQQLECTVEWFAAVSCSAV